MGLYGLVASLGKSAAQYKGYATFQSMMEANVGLTTVLVAFVVAAFMLFRVSRTLPMQGHTPIRNQAYLLLVKFVIGAFAVIVLFAIFAEGKKIIKESRLDQRIPVHSIDIA